MKQLLDSLNADLDTVKSWVALEDEGLKARGASSFRGQGKTWSFLVVGAGENIRDGTAVRLTSAGPGVPYFGMNAVRLSRELAVKAFAAASAS